MFVSPHITVNEKNHLSIGGADAVLLAQKYGTPLYVLEEATIRENCRMYVDSVKRYYDGNGMVLYASKALCTMALCKLAAEEHMGLDVVSGGELVTAHKAGFPMEHVYFHGNNKTREEISLAVSLGVGCIVADHMEEFDLIGEVCRNSGKTVSVLLRVKPGIDAHTHDYIRTGQIDSKFGFALETGEAMEAVKKAVSTPGISYRGLHCHIGSQIFELAPFCDCAAVMMDFIAEIRERLGVVTHTLNLGGGFGCPYTEEDDPIPYDKYMEAVSEVVHQKAKEHNLELPFILMEPGRSIVAAAGVTLYTVGGIKHIPDIRTYVSVDGGMTDNPRYILYKSEYAFLNANRAGDEKTHTVTVAGKCCESGDLLGENVKIQPIAPGEIMAVLTTGAYNYSMASHYNRTPNPAMVMVHNGVERVIVKRETYEDLLARDVL